MIKRFMGLAASLVVVSLIGCSKELPQDTVTSAGKTGGTAGNGASFSTCSSTYPNYFQDPLFIKTGMWANEVTINQPTPDWKGPVFRLSDTYHTAKPEQNFPWAKFNPFDPKLSPQEREHQAHEYIWAVMHYIQEGNIDSGDINTDWSLCNNSVRQWFHIPFQTYEPLSGREFVHGLTREAPVTVQLDAAKQINTTIWAVGFYNPNAAQGIGTVWKGANGPKMPQKNFSFAEGSVIGKLLFTTATPNQLPFLHNMPVWRANISAPEYCKCTPANGGECTFKEETEQCPRTVGQVYLLQFDIAVRDSRSPVGWAYGTFVADGQRKHTEKNPWNRIAALGLMWGNDTPPTGTGAVNYPVDPRKNGFQNGIIFWDAANMLNAKTNAGHLGCNSRLNGPADNAQSSCLSCHQSASVPDSANKTPAILYQFGNFKNSHGQCMSQPDKTDLAIDQVYFKSFNCATSFTGPADIVPPPKYASGQTQWISTDFSLQLSISLVQWQEWQEDLKKQQHGAIERVFDGKLPAR